MAILTELDSEVTALAQQAQAVVTIRTPEAYLLADGLLNALKAARRKILSDAKARKAVHYEPYKREVDREKALLALIDDPIARLEPAFLEYRRAQEAARVREEAARQQEATLAAAIDAEAVGDASTAQALINGELAVAPVILPRDLPKTSTSTVQRWSGECTDLLALVTAVAARLAPLELLTVNAVVLNRYANAQRATLDIPGCRAVMTEGTRGGRA